MRPGGRVGHAILGDELASGPTWPKGHELPVAGEDQPNPVRVHQGRVRPQPAFASPQDLTAGRVKTKEMAQVLTGETDHPRAATNRGAQVQGRPLGLPDRL